MEGARNVEQAQPSAEGLRYRKKLKARLAVERAALELVIERGFDGVTVEDICARAEISKKTFFNYFSSKAAAVMGRMDSFPDDGRLAEILEEHDEACYLDVLIGVVGTSFASGVDESIVNLRREALRSMPQLFFQRAARPAGCPALHRRRAAKVSRRASRASHAGRPAGRGGSARGVIHGHRSGAHALHAARVRRCRALGGRNSQSYRHVPFCGGCRFGLRRPSRGNFLRFAMLARRIETTVPVRILSRQASRDASRFRRLLGHRDCALLAMAVLGFACVFATHNRKRD